MKRETHAMEKVRYITHTADGRMVRSSTVNFFDEDGILNSSMCINQDITDLVALENAIKGMSDNKYFETTALPVTTNSTGPSLPFTA